jgi:hypothetical protein
VSPSRLWCIGAAYSTDDDADTVNDADEIDDDDHDNDPNGDSADNGNDDATVDADDADDVGSSIEAELPAQTTYQRQEPRSDERQEPRSDGRASRSHEATKRKHYAPGFKGKSYEMQFVSVPESKQASWANDCYRIAVGVMFTQMTVTTGMKLFGKRAVAAMFKEYNQLNDMMVFGRIDPDELTAQHKRDALHAVNLINEKRCGRVKGRTCADGSKQKAYIPREEATPPTVSMEALTASLVIDAHEKRAVAIFDVPGAYLNADMPDNKFVILKLEGKFVDIMCDVNPEYLRDIRLENGKIVLYLRILTRPCTGALSLPFCGTVFMCRHSRAWVSSLTHMIDVSRMP